MQLIIGLMKAWPEWYKRKGPAKVSSKSDAEKYEHDLPLILKQCSQEVGYPAGTLIPGGSTVSLIVCSKQFVTQGRQILT